MACRRARRKQAWHMRAHISAEPTTTAFTQPFPIFFQILDMTPPALLFYFFSSSLSRPCGNRYAGRYGLCEGVGNPKYVTCLQKALSVCHLAANNTGRFRKGERMLEIWASVARVLVSFSLFSFHSLTICNILSISPPPPPPPLSPSLPLSFFLFLFLFLSSACAHDLSLVRAHTAASVC